MSHFLFTIVRNSYRTFPFPERLLLKNVDRRVDHVKEKDDHYTLYSWSRRDGADGRTEQI